MAQIVLAVAVFTGIIVLLSALILLARSRLVETGVVQMLVNDDRDFQVPVGAKLLGRALGRRTRISLVAVAERERAASAA